MRDGVFPSRMTFFLFIFDFRAGYSRPQSPLYPFEPMKRFFFTLCLALMSLLPALAAKQPASHSVYTLRPEDPDAVFFTPDNYGFKADGKSDVTEALQQAINDVKTKYNFGILYLPEGEYRISKTITIPSSIRVIGYGKKRPVIYLADKTPGFQTERNYMVWFTGGIAQPGRQPSDAGAGTFYSAISNVDFRIGKGNPQAVAIRSHFAQHSFVSHIDFQLGDGLAGIWDLGNEVEDLRFYGGQYGIISSRPSPSWPVAVLDTYFEGQKYAAVLGKDLGATFIGMHVKNVPVAYESADDTRDIVYIERALFENVSEAAVKIAVEDVTINMINLQDITCSNTPVAVYYKPSRKKVTAPAKVYNIKSFTYGMTYDDIDDNPSILERCDMQPIAKAPASLPRELRPLPAMETWVSVKKYGAVGDGVTDDTAAFEKAIAENEVIYVPTGWYRLTRTLKLGPKTKLIGLHTYASQFVLTESEPAFSGFGGPVPMIESYPGGDNIFNGIGVFAGAFNYRAVGLKWQSGADSYLNDVKFVGGHGTQRKPAPVDPNAAPAAPRTNMVRGFTRAASSPTAPVYAQGKDLAWDNQYWSFWVTNGGGGTIKDVWSADTYAGAGVYISDTQTPGRIYAMSLEHHVRSEMRMSNVADWKIYCLQFEEESVEGPDCLNMEMSRCRDITFCNLWMYRVIRVQTPKHWGIRVWDSENIVVNNLDSYTQIVPILENPIYDVNKDIPVPTWNITKLTLTGKELTRRAEPGLWKPVKLADGFELAAGATADSKGNVYFSEHRQKKVYKWNADSGKLTFVADFPWKPLALATDTRDNLLAIVRYDPQPGYMVDGKQETVPVLPDDNPDYSGWGNGGWTVRVWSLDPDRGDESFTALPLVKSASVRGVQRVWHPGARRRPDFTEIAENMPEYSYLATDGVTTIPETFDLFRCSAVFPVTPGQRNPVYVEDELNKVSVAFSVNADGTLKRLDKTLPFGQYCDIVDADGNVYIADGDVVVYDKDGRQLRRMHVEDRPISLAIGGRNRDLLFITTSRGLYAARIK